jgi:hypothetical protein
LFGEFESWRLGLTFAVGSLGYGVEGKSLQDGGDKKWIEHHR